MVQLKSVYAGLSLSPEQKSGYMLTGTLDFSATYKEVTIQDAFQISISVPLSYPATLPNIKETGGRIPPDFHTNRDGTLCLDVPILLYKEFIRNPTLLHFIDRCALPFFYSFSYRERFGHLPFGEWEHGGEGLLQLYKEYFKHTEITALALIKILAENKYKGSRLCPCKSGKKLQSCHGPLLKNIQHFQGSKHYAAEFVQMHHHMKSIDYSLTESQNSKIAYAKAKKLSDSRNSGSGD